ncbi:MAG: hypothetical protein ACREK8_05650 [Gemmatimonadales bacterium]
MTAPDSFGLVVRVLGVLVLLYGVYHLLSTIFIVIAIGSGTLPVLLPLLIAGASLLVGFYLLSGAPLLQRIAYGSRS